MAALLAAGCGSSALTGTLEWRKAPAVFSDPGGGRSIAGFIRNTTSHAVDLDVRQMRLLDADGRRVQARLELRRSHLPPGAAASLVATWKAGKPVRIDYGSGTLALPSG